MNYRTFGRSGIRVSSAESGQAPRTLDCQAGELAEAARAAAS